MKKLILLALAVVVMAGCDMMVADSKNIAGVGSFEEFRKIREERELEYQKWRGYEVLVIDSCEYLEKVYKGYKKAAIGIVHKGNCKFCAERRKQELQEIVRQLKEE